MTEHVKGTTEEETCSNHGVRQISGIARDFRSESSVSEQKRDNREREGERKRDLNMFRLYKQCT